MFSIAIIILLQAHKLKNTKDHFHLNFSIKGNKFKYQVMPLAKEHTKSDSKKSKIKVASIRSRRNIGRHLERRKVNCGSFESRFNRPQKQKGTRKSERANWRSGRSVIIFCASFYMRHKNLILGTHRLIEAARGFV
jgi:hypothetical protein